MVAKKKKKESAVVNPVESAEHTPVESAVVVPPVSNKPVRYRVAKGRSVICKKGILTGGAMLTEKMVSGGIENLEGLVKGGYAEKF